MINVYKNSNRYKSNTDILNCGFGVSIGFGATDNAADFTFDAKVDEELQEALQYFHLKNQVKIKVKDGIVYTNKIGLVIGQKGANIKPFAKEVGRQLQVKKLVLGEEELLEGFKKNRYPQNEVLTVFWEAFDNNYKKILNYLAEGNYNTQVHNGDQYDHEGYVGENVAKILHYMGYNILAENKFTVRTFNQTVDEWLNDEWMDPEYYMDPKNWGSSNPQLRKKIVDRVLSSN